MGDPTRRGATLTEITVEGFRGIGPRRSLRLTPGPGLTLVVGRNGSGKSSFAEGVEILLTGVELALAQRPFQRLARGLAQPARGRSPGGQREARRRG